MAATLTLSDAGSGNVEWSITGLSADVSWYSGFGMARDPISNGIIPPTRPVALSGVPYGESYLGYGSHTLYGYANRSRADGDIDWWGAGSDSIYLTPPVSNFYWINSLTRIAPGDNISSIITVSKWNSFLDSINSHRAYKGYSTVNFSDYYGNNIAARGKSVYAYMYNNAKLAMSQWRTRIDVSPGERITAEHFNWLQDTLNSVT